MDSFEQSIAHSTSSPAATSNESKSLKEFSQTMPPATWQLLCTDKRFLSAIEKNLEHPEQTAAAELKEIKYLAAQILEEIADRM